MQVSFITWLIPEKNESIEAYAKRIAHQIHDSESVYMGLSFGGIIAAEVAKWKRPRKLILIASIQSKDDMPLRYRLIRFLRIHQIVPAGFLKRSNFITYWFFGVKTNDEKQVLAKILQETNPVLLKWSIHALLNWQNKQLFEPTIRIHGNKDRILPCSQGKMNYVIENAGHFMVYTHADTIGPILIECAHQA